LYCKSVHSDLVAYLLQVGPDDVMSWSTVRCLVAIRRTLDRPMSLQAYAAIRRAVVAHEARAA
jgi:hypothetical protein